MGRILPALALLLVAGCTSEHLTFLDPQGPVASAQLSHLIKVVGLLMIVVLPVLVLTPVIAWRYRRRNARSRYAPKWDFAWPLEIAIWVVPVGVVAVMAVLLWRSTQALDPYEPLQVDGPPLRVQVVGLDWKWLFIYPDLRVATVGDLAFPADRPLALELTTDTVMQSFFIPALGSQIYAMAGMVTKLHLAADGPGRFHGLNTQFNGTGFPKQRFIATAMTAGDFTAWVDKVRASGIALDEATYDQLARRSTVQDARETLGATAMPEGVLHFKAPAPDLFATIVNQYHLGQTGRSSSRPGPAAAGASSAPHQGVPQETNR